jgi:hypothetical protein
MTPLPPAELWAPALVAVVTAAAVTREHWRNRRHRHRHRRRARR